MYNSNIMPPKFTSYSVATSARTIPNQDYSEYQPLAHPVTTYPPHPGWQQPQMPGPLQLPPNQEFQQPQSPQSQLQPQQQQQQPQQAMYQPHLFTTSKSSTPMNTVSSPYLTTHPRSPIASYSPVPIPSTSIPMTMPIPITNYPPNNTTNIGIKLEDQDKFQLKSKLKDQRTFSLTSTPSSNSSFSSTSKITKPRHNIHPSLKTNVSSPLKQQTPSSETFVNRQTEISPLVYTPSDPTLDISEFTEEDIIILKNLLSSAEIHKWKYISNRLSKNRSKKLNAEYCINKFHTMYGLPFSPKNSLLHSNYFLKLYKEKKPQEENFEGMLGSSIPYIVSKDGWNLIDP